MTAERQAVLVVGMHRSGTSALTRTFNLLGCDVPKTLLGAKKSNPTGHWESVAINRLNDEILESAGNHWRRLEPVPASWFQSEHMSTMRSLALEVLTQEYGDSTNFVLKDPRISKLLPFWQQVLRDFGASVHIVSVARSPQEVAASLRARDGFDPNHSDLLWLIYVLEAERHSRSQRRVFLTYDQILSDWQDAIGRAEREVAVSLPARTADTIREIDSLLVGDHRHHREMDDSHYREFGQQWSALTWRIMQRWAETGEQAADYSTLDEISDAMSDVFQKIGIALTAGFEATVSVRTQKKLRLSAEASVESAKQDAELSAHAASEQEKQLAALQERLARLTGLLDEARAKLVEAHLQYDAARSDLEIARHDAEVSRVSADHHSRMYMAATANLIRLEKEIEILIRQADRDADRIEKLRLEAHGLIRSAAANEAATQSATEGLRDTTQRLHRASVAIFSADKASMRATELAATLTEKLSHLERRLAQ